jgi:transposase
MATSACSQEKLASLRQHGALNPHPQTVIDEAFISYDFFDPHDLIQVKYEMLRRVHTEGQSICHAAAAFGFSRPSFYQAQAALAQSGLAGLLPRRRGPKSAHKLRDEVLDFIEQARSEEPSLRSEELVQRVRDQFGLSLHPRSIERALAWRQKKSSRPAP